VLDDILRLFRRRRRAPARTPIPAVSGRLAMNLANMGGPIYRTRGDSMPQLEPRLAARRPVQADQRDDRQASRSDHQAPRSERQATPDSRKPSEPAQPLPAAPQAKGEARQLAEPPRKKPAAAKSVPLAAQASKAARHVAEHGNYLAAHAVEKTFGNRKVVKGASLYVRRGEAVGLLGPNGAGKTTIFYMITGLIKADVGRIELDGYDVTALPMYQRARLGIGYLPQEASIFRGLSVEENIRAVLEVVEPNRKKRERELTALLEEFNIERLRKTPSIALSGGERRRVEIARSLATRPSYMLLDEPFAGIDPIAVGDIRQLVRHLTSRGIGVLITDHNVRETLGLTDRAYIIYSGEVLMEGRTEDIVNNPEVRRLYLGEEFRL
jgi:lipopolysaccharide export system ATP-binding protein